MLFVVADQDAPGLLERAYFGGESSGAAADAAAAIASASAQALVVAVELLL